MDAQGDLFKFYDGVAGHASVRNGQLTGSLLSAVYGPVTVARRVTGTQARPEPPMASHGQAAAHAGQEFVSESAAGASVVGPRPGRRGHGGHRDVGGHHFSATVTSLARRRRQLGYAACRGRRGGASVSDAPARRDSITRRRRQSRHRSAGPPGHEPCLRALPP